MENAVKYKVERWSHAVNQSGSQTQHSESREVSTTSYRSQVNNANENSSGSNVSSVGYPNSTTSNPNFTPSYASGRQGSVSSSAKNFLEQEEPSIYLDRYVVEKTLGEGSFGKVKMATDLKFKRKVAIKIIDKSILKKVDHVTRIKREVRILRLLNHPNIVKLHDVAETDKEIVLAMEYIDGGELFDFIVANPRLPERTCRRIFRQIVSALDYCHQSSIIHRDLKPENLLMDVHKNVKLVDFGFVNIFENENTLNTFCGSPYYASPEMILGRQYTGPEVDVWSLGVILFALITGQLPFRDSNTTNLYKKIVSGIYEIPDHVSKSGADLIKRMLVNNPSERASLNDIKTDPWIVQDFGSPPDSHIPPRPSISKGPLDMNIVEGMKLYGFSVEEAVMAIQSSPDGAAVSLYHLLKEKDTYERAYRNSLMTQSSTISVGSDDSSSSYPSTPLKSIVSNGSGRGPHRKGSINSISSGKSMGAAQKRFVSKDDGKMTSRLSFNGPFSTAPKSFSNHNSQLSVNDQASSNNKSKLRDSATTNQQRRHPIANVTNNDDGYRFSVEEDVPIKTVDSSKLEQTSTTTTVKSANSKLVAGITKMLNIFLRKGENTPPTAPTRIANPNDHPQIRTVKSFYSSSVTSSKSASDLKAEIERVLVLMSIQHEWNGLLVHCTKNNLKFDIEICILKGTNIHGFESKRKKGSRWAYQECFKTLLSSLAL